ncbi:MAG: FHA domain-containing protein, partial [Chlorobi bacterium]|nr:FHA domain-containing protein [Chlorobiota bacterium]
FNIKYNNQTYQYSFNRVKSSYLTNREQVLLMLSALLLIVLFIIIYKNKKAINKIQLNQIKDFKPSSAIPVKNIEINVKTKGFNKTYFFEKHIIRIGRGEDNDIVIPDRTVSVYHALINREGNEFMLQDLGSTNGVLINQKKIKKQSLNTNDKIKMGAAILIVRV